MCGIAGIFSLEALTPRRVEGALNALKRRGPDGSGKTFFSFSEKKLWSPAVSGTAALLHTRLSIQDLSLSAAQPMSNEDGSLWIVYNGEVYGWEERARYLRDRGHHFKSYSDTEFILHGYAEWGDKVLDHLRGMFSFALFDRRQQRLFLARDRMGEKPLFYTWRKGTFSFASTTHALANLAFPQGKPSLNSQSIDAFLAHRYIPAPLSIFEGIQKLLPAHSMVVEFDQGEPILSSPHCYWTPSPQPQEDPAQLLRESIDLRLLSDRPLGLFLSGGIDSQAIAASLGQNPPQQKLQTVTASFPNNPSYNEAAPAAAIAARWGHHHTELPMVMNPADAFSIVRDLDEPFADPSALPTWYLCQAAVKKMTVALTGDGGDELFAGYKRYEVHGRAARLLTRHGVPPAQWKSASPCLKNSSHGRLRRLLLAYQLGWEEAYALRFSAMDPLTRSFLQPDFSVRSSYWRKPQGKLPPREWMLECDRLNYLPEYILRKSDLCGMAHGLELRSPMLDHRFVQAVYGMKTSERFTHPPKHFLRERLIGHDAITGPKRGFNPPLQQWLHEGALAIQPQVLAKDLENLTLGQLSASRTTQFLNLAIQESSLNELLWLLLVLSLSLKKE